MVTGRFSESRTSTPKPSIEKVFEHYYPEVEIDVYGAWSKILCPIHVEDRPSASINLELNRWFCHVCDISEDSIDVIRREEEMSFGEAQEFANAWLGGIEPAVSQPVPRKPSREVSHRPRFGGGSNEVAPRVRRRFGESGP